MFNHIKTDPELCIGCKTCMAACVASHTGKALFAMKPVAEPALARRLSF